jgi:2-dehydro-3-deoxyphosphogluconate aldolase/(4S)-4-hydroxy-2-oxoglutarate aldolase
MKKVEILNKLEKAGVIAVVRGATAEEAAKSSEAIIAGGITGIELTFTVPQVEKVISDLVQKYKNQLEVIIGAGTVLDAVTARLAIMSGAQFIVSPCFDAETAKICNLYQIPYIPGCLTITEMKTALEAGCDIIKLFPGSAFGPDIIKAFKAPLPHLNIMPTGGVSMENMADWFKAGAVAVGVGGNLLAPAAKGDFDEVSAVAKEYMNRFQEIKPV